MKTCPYCAQQVDDQATRCPYCRNDLGQPAAQAAPPAGPPPPAADPPPPPPPVAPGPPAVVGEGALRFSHSGERYLLGYGEDFFGIWDRNVPGPAVMRFPRTDQGWAEAWGQFAAREPHAVAVPAAGAAQGAPSSAGYRDGHGRATLLMVLLGAMGGIEVITAIVAQGLITQLRAGGLAVVSAVDRAQSLVGLGALL